MIGRVSKFDQKISTPVIQLDKLLISWILYPFAAFFHPKLIWIAYALVFYISKFDLHATLIYLLGTGVCLLTTYILKRYTKRSRPLLNENVKKSHRFRKKQKNHSFPSGDAIQSALFVNFLHFLGVPWFYLIIFHVLVCLGRVYFMCHWVMDTVVSTVLGTAISSVMIQLITKQTFKPLIQQTLGFTVISFKNQTL